MLTHYTIPLAQSIAKVWGNTREVQSLAAKHGYPVDPAICGSVMSGIGGTGTVENAQAFLTGLAVYKH